MLKMSQVYKSIFLYVPHEQHCNFLLPLTPQQEEPEKVALLKQLLQTIWRFTTFLNVLNCLT